MNCPQCGSMVSYVGLEVVECTHPQCANFRTPTINDLWVPQFIRRLVESQMELLIREGKELGRTLFPESTKDADDYW